MSSGTPRRRLASAAALFLALAAACGPSSFAATSVPAASATVPTNGSVTSTIVPAPSPRAPVSTAPAAVTPSSANAPVLVSALGNVYIRRGPDLAFNPVGLLSKGEVATAAGRDVLSNWVRVPLPEDVSRYGWISIMSEFTQVTGIVAGLPEIDPQEWPDLAWLRNCTFHELWIAPIGLAVPPAYEFPNNELRLDPGTYTITDADVDGYPEILKVEIREGKTIEVLIDGLGEKKKCPRP